ncbi:LysE family translocator [Psychrobacter ciconiae]|uniref:LysE family translocator n=1 Tax=Psychrobacter ciconiae TaxID=1553449 RepID=UPI00191B055C|nr:LysE family translocator [Psychrobacter ciconiae]
MSWQWFLAFFASTFLISATPGPNMLLAFQYGLNYGIKKTLWTLAGLSTGLFMLLVATLLGLDVISRQSPWILLVIKAVGGAYLLYLGISAWRDTTPSSLAKDARALEETVNSEGNFEPVAKSVSAAAVSFAPPPRTLFKTGFWVALSNPKAILFFAAFFPKFINFNAPLLPQYIVLTIGLFVSETIWQLIYTSGGKKLSSWLDVGARLLWLNRGCGVIFMLIAAALLIEVAGNIF